MRSLLRRILNRHGRDGEVERELAFHVLEQIDAYKREGMSLEEATRRTRLEFGGVQQIKEDCREALGWRLLDELRQDARFALRQLRHSPGFTLAVVATLTLGIGANTAIFSVVHALLLKPLAYASDSDRLVRVIETLPPAESYTGAPLRLPVTLNAAEAREVRSAKTLSAVGLSGPMQLRLSTKDQDARVQGARITRSTFDMLHASPFMGHLFSPEDEVPGGQAVVLLSFAAWQQWFHADPRVVGQGITLATTLLRPIERQFVVIGVMPRDFSFPDNTTALWIPLRGFPQAPFTDPEGDWNRAPMLAQLAAGASVTTAAAEIEPMVRRIRSIKPSDTLQLVREQDQMVALVRPALLVLAGAVGLVLLIACVNVANLLLARNVTRQREIAIRRSLGASGGRLFRQALTESGLIAVLGGGAGLLCAFIGIEVLRSLLTTLPRFDLGNTLAFPRVDEIGLDIPVLAFAGSLSLLTGIACGLGPAVKRRRVLVGAPRSRWRASLVVAQVSLAMVLLIGAGLLMRSFFKLTSVRTGFEAANVLTFQVDLPMTQYPDARLRSFADSLVARVQSIPGVRLAASANQVPMVDMKDTAGGLWRTANHPEKEVTGNGRPVSDCRLVSRDYLRVMGIRILSGRGFSDSDGTGQPQVILINEALARRDFPNENPIGQLVYVGTNPSPWQVVGIVDDVRMFGLDRAAEPQFFVDMRQWSPAVQHLFLFPAGSYFAAKVAGDPGAVAGQLSAVARQLEPHAVVFNVASMEDIIATTTAKPRLYTWLVTIFAIVGISLAVIGLAGVIAYSVTQRTREFGVQMALGASRRRILGSVLGQGLKLTIAGLLVGLALSAVATRSLQSLLFGVGPFDLPTVTGVACVLALFSLLAAYVPARRASRIDPMNALRCE